MTRKARRSSETRTAVAALARQHRWMLMQQTFLGVVNGAAEAIVLVLVTRVALAAVGEQRQLSLGPLGEVGLLVAVLVAVGVLAVRILVGITLAHRTARLVSHSLTATRSSLVATFFGAEWAEIGKERLGDLQTLLTSNAERASVALINIAYLVMAISNFAVIAALAFAVSPIAALASVVAAVVLLVAMRPLVRRTRDSARELQRTTRELSALTTEATRMALETRTFGVELAVVSELQDRYRDAERSVRKGRFALLVAPQIYSSVAFLLIICGALGIAAWGSANAESAGASLLLLLRGFSYAQQSQMMYQNLIANVPFIDEIAARQAELGATSERNDYRSIGGAGLVSVDRVTFAYEDKPALTDVTFQIAPGEVIGVVGASGSGKSTLIQLILGLREPDEGSILIGGMPPSEIDPDQLRSKVSFVPQEPKLFRGSVAENIRYRRDLTFDAIQDAADLAFLADEIRARGGYSVEVGENGSFFSGGQRQRITIARALAGSPDLVILDEPTSALDEEAAEQVHEGLATLKGRVTLLVVSHRPDTLAICDRVLVLDAGRATMFDNVADLEHVPSW